MSVATQTQEAVQARVEAAQARVEAAQARAQARVDAELARARAAVASAEQQGGNQTSITTSPDGRTATINENGKITKIVTGDDGRVMVSTPDGTTKGAFTGFGRNDPPPFPRDQIPDGVVPLAGIFFGMIACTIIGFPIARAYARRMDRKTVAPAASPDLGMRLDRIEQAIETMAVEVERVSEAQRYSARLLTERLPETPTRAIPSVQGLEQSR